MNVIYLSGGFVLKEKNDMLITGLILVIVIMFLVDAVLFIRIMNVEKRLRSEMNISIGSVHERINQINSYMNKSICDLEIADKELADKINETKNIQKNTNHALSRLRRTLSDFVERSNRSDNESDNQIIIEEVLESQQASYEARDGMEFFGTWDISAYEWTEPQSPCANGNYPTVMYSAACNYLPFGTRIYIEGVGDFVIEDRIGVDSRIDIFLGDVETCKQFGVQSHNVYIYN